MNASATLAARLTLIAAVLAGSPGWAQPTGAAPEGAAAGGPAREAEAVRLPLPPAAPRIASGPEYERCLSQLALDPAETAIFADAWEATGGGDGAAHCRALAVVGTGNAAAGAEMLQALAGRSQASSRARAGVYGQAGQAWLIAGDAGRAFGAVTLALLLAPEDPDLLIDRSIASATLEHYQDAVDDLSLALAADPRRVDALVFRAAARRHLDQLDPAGEDIDRAVAADPDNPEALLERGILRQRRGDPTGARLDWEQAVTLAPGTPAGDLAAQNLALLDAGGRR